MNPGVSRKLLYFFIYPRINSGALDRYSSTSRTGVHSDSWLLTPEFFFGKDGFASGRLKLSPKAGFGKGGFRKDIGHYIRSSYEHVFALWLIHQGLYYKYEPQVFTLNINNEVTTFTPDFWVDGYWFEIKNPYNITLSSFQEKLKEFKLQYPDEVIFIIVGDSTWNNPEAINVTISNLPELAELIVMLKQVVCIKD